MAYQSILCERIAQLESADSREGAVSEAGFCTLAEAINDGLAMIDENLRFIYVNNRFCEITGYRQDEIIGRIVDDFLDEANQKILTDQLARRKKGKGDLYELALVQKGGKRTFVLVSPRPIFSADGSFKGSIAVLTDISDLKRAEEQLLSATQELELRVQERTADVVKANEKLKQQIATRVQTEEKLRESEQRYRSLFKNNHSVMLLIDPKSADIIDANSAACSFYGWSQEELTSMKITDINILSNKQVFQEMELAKAEKRHYFLFRHRLANEELRDVEVYGGPIRLRGKDLLYSIIHDITDRKRAEEEKQKLERQLLQSNRLEAISTLSGGVAQELSNLFQAVHGYVERLMWGKDRDDPNYQELLEITNAAFRGAVLSKRLLAFSGQIKTKKQAIELNQEIKKTYNLLIRTMPESIDIELQLTNEPAIINADPNQIEQALLALSVNAREAMPDGGKIIIGTKRMTLDQDFRRTHAGVAMRESILVTVSDTGPGLGNETLEHVFDPFYSREDQNDKTGLGLSMVYGIVRNHGGYISCSSESSVGTTFRIYLPISEKGS